MDSDACAQPPARLAGYPSLDDHDSFGMHMPRPDPVIMQEMANARELGLGRSPDAPSRALHSPAWNDDGAGRCVSGSLLTLSNPIGRFCRPPRTPGHCNLL